MFYQRCQLGYDSWLRGNGNSRGPAGIALTTSADPGAASAHGKYCTSLERMYANSPEPASSPVRSERAARGLLVARINAGLNSGVTEAGIKNSLSTLMYCPAQFTFTTDRGQRGVMLINVMDRSSQACNADNCQQTTGRTSNDSNDTFQ